MQKIYGAQGILTDEHGRDLLTNEDRSDLVRTRAPPAGASDHAHGREHGRARRRTTAATGSSSSCRASARASGFSRRDTCS